jgi:hypothetical protein
MRKSTLFISVVLTTFMLAVLYGVVSAYQSVVKSTELAAAQPQPTTVVEVVSQPMAVVPPTQEIPPQVVNLTPEAAAALASKILGRTDLYSVETAQFEGADAYLVTFSSGDIVYISLDGQILSISKLPVTVITQSTGGGGGGGGGGSNNTSSGEHEDNDDEEHEGGDDDGDDD